MNEALTLTLWNAILPLAGLCALVCWMPGWLVGRGNLSQGALARAVGVTAVVALVVGAVLAAGLYAGPVAGDMPIDGRAGPHRPVSWQSVNPEETS